jgi:hypothetical protein
MSHDCNDNFRFRHSNNILKLYNQISVKLPKNCQPPSDAARPRLVFFQQNISSHCFQCLVHFNMADAIITAGWLTKKGNGFFEVWFFALLDCRCLFGGIFAHYPRFVVEPCNLQSWRRRYFVLRFNKTIEYFEYAGDGSDHNVVDRAGLPLPGKGGLFHQFNNRSTALLQTNSEISLLFVVVAVAYVIIYRQTFGMYRIVNIHHGDENACWQGSQVGVFVWGMSPGPLFPFPLLCVFYLQCSDMRICLISDYYGW